MPSQRNYISIDRELWLELKGLRQRMNVVRGINPAPGLTLPGAMEVLLCHTAEFGLNDEFVKNFEPMSLPGRPRIERERPPTLLRLQEKKGGSLYPHV